METRQEARATFTPALDMWDLGLVLLALLAGPSPSALPPWDEAPIQIRHMLAFADKAYMHKKVQSWLGAQLEARLHACPHASHEAKATVRSLLQVCVCVCVHLTAPLFPTWTDADYCARGCVSRQMDPAARLLPHQLLAPGTWLNPHLTDPRLNRPSDPSTVSPPAGSAPAASFA